MKKRTCIYCQRVFEDVSGKVFANHVRWCDKNTTNGDKGRSKFGLIHKKREIVVRKTCLKCGKEFEVKLSMVFKPTGLLR